ncbi:WD40 repeat-like protein [Peniophora sp. CONT]|nr:WD40 repeat-like protein [Peniophora sp. CONT]
MPGFPNEESTNGPSAPTSKRKQTLLTLLAALQELNDDDLGQAGGNQEPSFEDDKDVPTVDEHLQKVGAEAFHRFTRKLNNLDKELRNFSNSARQLGSSVGILSSTYHLRERLTIIGYLFRENAADLFPRKIPHESKEALHKPAIPTRGRAKSKPPPHVRRPVVVDPPEQDEFPEQIKKLAQDVITFLHCLNEFPEFTDEAVNASIVAFEGDLKYWASCLRSYEGQFRYPAVQRYLHDLTEEMGDHIESITQALSMFVEIGVPTIRFAQKHGANNLLNLSTVATFFSAVTATTLQFSFETTGTPAADAVNGFWFTSMVFSIAAAVNSLLGLTWKQAMYRSPGHRVPWWVLIWIKRSPLVFLVLSVACFSVGLVVFSYSSNQHRIVTTLTTVFTACSSFGLTAVSAWFAFERYAFNRHKGTKWLSDMLEDTWDTFLAFGPFQVAARHWNIAERKTSIAASEALGRVRRAKVRVRQVPSRVREKLASSPHTIPSSSSGESIAGSMEGAQSPVAGAASSNVTGRHRRQSGSTHFTDPHSQSARSPLAGSTTELLSEKEGTATVPGTPTSPTPSSPGRTRLKNMVRSVMMMQAAAGKGPRAQRTVTSSSLITPNRKDTLYPPAPRASRVAALVTKLRNLGPTEDLAAHTALVRHLQFSPDGKFLATSSWDRTSVIFQTGTPFMHHRTLAHPSGFVGQVAWSPSGNMLLTKLNRSIKVWTETGVCTRTIERGTTVQSITWMPGGEAFLSVEGGSVALVDLTGKQVDTFHFDRLKIHDVSVTPDGLRMLGVGKLLSTQEGLKPSTCRDEKQIISYNIERKEIESQVPILHEVRDITMAKSGQYALVSYEFKAPPQLWKLEIIRQRMDVTEAQADAAELPPVYTSRLSLRHTYMPKFQVDFAGPSYFGGKDDQLVLCAGKAGDIHIWDRESGALLHHIRAQNFGGGDLTCIAWNPAADPYIFATGSHDGAVRVWTTLPPGPTAPPSINEPPGQNSRPNSLIQRDRSPRPTPRSITPLSDTGSAGQYLDAEQYRTESPTQQDFDVPTHTIGTRTPNRSRSGSQLHLQTGVQTGSQDTLSAPQPIVAPPLRRTVAFQTPQALGNVGPSHPTTPSPPPDGPSRSSTL